MYIVHVTLIFVYIKLINKTPIKKHACKCENKVLGYYLLLINAQIKKKFLIKKIKKAPGGVEPSTSCLLDRRSNQLSYGAAMLTGRYTTISLLTRDLCLFRLQSQLLGPFQQAVLSLFLSGSASLTTSLLNYIE